MSAKPSTVSPSPCTTVAVRCGVQRAASRAQLVLTTFGTTTSSGKAFAASAASSAWAVLPRPGSSASRNVRWPAAAAATSCPWCGISSRPAGVNRAVGAGSAMHAGAPPPARSKELSSGPSSSHPVRRRGREVRCGTAEKSGARKGFASCPEITDCGTTRRSVPAGAAAASAGAISSGAVSMPRSRNISRLSDRAASETSASSASNASSPASRTAVVARMAAMPSKRLSCSARRLSLPPAARTRARSSRSIRATAWNLARTPGVTRPRWTAASTSRTLRASTETTSPRSPRGRADGGFRGAARRALAWRWPPRATNSSSERRGTVAAAACRTVPSDGATTPRAEGLVLRAPSRLADLGVSTRPASARSHTRTPHRRRQAGDHGAGAVVVGRPVRFSGTSLMVTRARAQDSRPGALGSSGAVRAGPGSRVPSAGRAGTRRQKKMIQVTSRPLAARYSRNG